MGELVITVGGRDLSPREGSLSWDSATGQRGVATMAQLLTGNTRAVPGETITIVDGGTTVFSGTVDSAREIAIDNLSNTEHVQGLVCVDNNAILDRFIVARVYENMLAGDIVKDIVAVDLAGEGITTGAVADGPTIARARFGYVTVAQAFESLALSSGFLVRLPEDKNLRFSAPTVVAAPVSITDDDGPVWDMAIRQTRDTYRNDQTLIGGIGLTDSLITTITAVASQTEFNVVLPIGAVPSVKEDTVTKTIGILGLEGDTGSDYFWNFSSNIITRASGATGGEIIEITFKGEVRIVDRVLDSPEITARAAIEATTGVYQHVATDTQVDTYTSANLQANGLLTRYSSLPTVATFKIATAGFFAGQSVTINLTAWDINAVFLIGSVKARVEKLYGTDTARVVYSIEARTGEFVQAWGQWYQQFVAGRELVIGSDEVLPLISAHDDRGTIDETVTITSAAPTPIEPDCVIGFCEMTA